MSSGYQIQTVIVAEGFNCVSAKQITCTSGWNWPSFYHLRIRPKQIAHYSFLWHLPKSIYFLKVIDLFDVWGETSMHTEDFVIDDSCDGKIVENISKRAPNIQRPVFFDALIIETVDLSDQSRLMVTSQQRNSATVSDFES